MKRRGFKRLLPPLFALFLGLSIGGRAIADDPAPAIASVQKVSGVAVVVRQGQTIPAQIGLEIWENDTLRTGPDGSIGVVFNDDTVLSLGPKSALVIDKYIFAPQEGDYSIILRMVKGTAAYISGLISKIAPESAHFETPSASIGFRGTRCLVKVELEQK